ncbi:MAG TPA: ParB/RepB/Spo0J family partition protein [Planctomycetota bacterium]|nr:ParB/RepB/Spo0J family partition protein [Planctomycetota bacterium]
MSDDKKRLGRGLDSLISSARSRALSVEVIRGAGLRVQRIPVDLLDPNPYQPRVEFRIEALNDLVNSLREHGLMQPIVVRRHEERFQIIAGERRWRASQELGWEMIDAVAIDADDRKMIEWALVENIQREQLGAMELARAFRQMNREFGQTQEEISKAVGMSRPSVANTMRLLDLPQEVQDRVSRGTLAPGAARALLALPQAEAQVELAEEIERTGLNVRGVEERVKKAMSPSRAAAVSAPTDANLTSLERELSTLLATRVAIKGTLSRGRLVLDFHSTRELDRLVRKLRGEAPRLAAPTDEELGEERGALKV